MKKITKSLLCIAMAMTIAGAATPNTHMFTGSDAVITASAAGFTVESVGGTGSNSIPLWKEINSDVKGWLRIPGTNINWPVVVGKDNLYYNNLDYYKRQNKDGVIWADSDTKFGDKSKISKNTVLYGHNWLNIGANPRIRDEKDVMFGQLTGYHHLDFAQETPYIHYSTEDQSMTWKVFAAFYTEDKFNYIISDPDDKTFEAIIKEARDKSRHDFNVEVDKTDKIITLSTCTRAYGQREDQRFVVMARLMRPGEKIEEVKVTENKDFVKPKF